jgi:diguanylate cyclase (GGDEF)-like protein
MTLDTRTILVLLILHSAAIGVALIATARGFSRPVWQTMANWGAASLVMALAFLLLSLRGMVPDFLSIVVANMLMIVSLGEYYQSFRTFDGDAPRRLPPLVLAFLVGLLVCVFRYVDNNLSVRTGAGTGATGALLLTIAARLLLYRESHLTAIRRITGIGYSLLGGLYIGRAIFALYLGPEMPNFLSNSAMEATTFTATSVAFVLITLSFLLMCSERINRELACLSVTDPLTGLANRRAADEFVEREIGRAVRNRASLAMLMIDADGLKAINDAHGHRAGDLALTTIANIMKRNCRHHDIAARLGGDEFALVLPDTDSEGADAMATRLSSQVKNTILQFDGKSIRLGISVGTALLDPGNPDYDDLVHRADQALYAIKRSR